MPKDWLQTKHPLWEEREDEWKRAELRLDGGEAVLEELVPFRWEENDTREVKHVDRRRRQATYINFPDLFAKTMVGHLTRNAPEPDEGLDFGELGRVETEEEGDPSQASLVFFNADGVGNDGSQWDNFWGAATRQAMATGHRWIFVEAPVIPPETIADEQEGQRPWLVEYSPLAVTNWDFTDGKLDFAIIRIARRSPRIEREVMEGNDPEDAYLLLVREEFENFGDEFAGGGWWMYDEDMEPIEFENGTWEKTLGEIPLFPLFYERSNKQLSRSGLSEISQAAVAYMNMSSAADFDAWDAAQSMQFLLGVDIDSYNLAVKKMKDGSKMIPLPPNKKTGDTPQVYDGSSGAVVAGVFETRLQRKLDEARELAALEATSTPESSGKSKQAGFSDVRAPRLALLASEVEQAQNTAIRFLELRFGHEQPSGEVTWPRDFELLPLVDSIRELFELLALSDMESIELSVRSIMSAVRTKGLAANEEQADVIEAELRASVEARRARESQDGAVAGTEAEVQNAIEGALAAEEAGAPDDLTGLEVGV